MAKEGVPAPVQEGAGGGMESARRAAAAAAAAPVKIWSFHFFVSSEIINESIVTEIFCPSPVFLPGESHGQRSLVGYSPWGLKGSDTTEVTEHAQSPFPWVSTPSGQPLLSH